MLHAMEYLGGRREALCFEVAVVDPPWASEVLALLAYVRRVSVNLKHPLRAEPAICRWSEVVGELAVSEAESVGLRPFRPGFVLTGKEVF